MSTKSKQWIVASPAPPDVIHEYRGINSVIAQILYNRGFTSPSEADEFLQVTDELINPFEMKGMNEAVRRIRLAIRRKELIIVYGDFDADGVTSTALMMQTLTALGAVAKPYIPHRVDEGYGVNSQALIRLAHEGAKLIITVDCGIRSVSEIEDGIAAGLDIIVTDHHSIGPEIPQTIAVLNPKQVDCNYPEDMLAGVGVAFKLADALLRVSAVQDRQQLNLQLEDLLDLVAIGTVADLAPLDRLENRLLVQRGLAVLNRAQRPGIRALLEVSNVEPGKVSAMTIGFALGPRINAAGRLESAMIAFHLLTAKDYEHALALAQQLQSLNVQRQELTRQAQESVRQSLALNEVASPLIFASGQFKSGIVGLVAGRLTEEFFRPAVIMEEGELESRASCRSIPQFDITRALDQCADLLVRHGGHAQAAGFTVVNVNIPALREKLMRLAADTLAGQDLRPMLEIDADLTGYPLSEKLVEELKRLEPTGYMNPTPIFMLTNLRVLDKRSVGKDSQHIKLKLAHGKYPPMDAIGFGLGHWMSELPQNIDAAFQLEINEWNGYRTLQLNLQDIRPTQVDRWA